MAAEKLSTSYDTAPARGEKQEIFPAHQEALRRIQRVMSRAAKELPVTQVTEINGNNISPSPGVYIIMGPEGGRSADGEVSSIDFNLASQQALSGRADSAHAALTGELTITYEGFSSAVATVSVVAKDYHKRPIADSFERVRREVDFSRRQAMAGEITYEPIAVVVTGRPYGEGHTNSSQDYDIILMTRFVPSATTLDNAPWALGCQPENVAAAEAAVAALARFNTGVGLHGDAKIKNVAQLPDGRTSMIDFETSKLMDTREPIAAATVASQDFASLLDSLMARKFFTRQSDETVKVVSKLGEVYLDAWGKFSPEVQEAVINEVTAITDKYTNSGSLVVSG